MIKKESDHNTIITEIKYNPKQASKVKRNELFNLNDKECQKTFKSEMDNTTVLSKIIEKNEDVEKGTKKFLKRLNGFLCKHFKKSG